jgi:hypothetical protein
MIQFNLLPDVKQEYVKARRMKRLVMLASLAVSGAAIFLLLLMITTVDVVQKKSLHDLNNDIAKYSKQLKSTPDLDKILTVQNQLNTLTGLHDKKVVTSRVFRYIAQVTPGQTSISKLTVNFSNAANSTNAAGTFDIQGEAPTLDAVNAFTEELKSTTYIDASAQEWELGSSYKQGDTVLHVGAGYIATHDSTADGSNEPGLGSHWHDNWKAAPNAFSKVVLTAFGRDDKGATFTIDLSYDPAIFDSTNDVKLTVLSGAGGAQALLFQKQAGN